MSNKAEKRAYGAQLKQQAATRNKQQLRRSHLEAQGGKCFLCKESLTFEKSVLGHRTSRSNGGEDTPENTFAAHEACARYAADVGFSMFKVR